MTKFNSKTRYSLVLCIAGLLSSSPVTAEKLAQSDVNKGKNSQAAERNEKGGKPSAKAAKPPTPSERNSSRSSSVKSREYFSDQHRSAIHDYYSAQISRGFCPPGLAKKQNGCMPPGQAKKWTIGRPLPRDVIFYDLPRPLLDRLDRVPTGYRYVRVATDILLIAIGTGMVIDAIEDLGRM